MTSPVLQFPSPAGQILQTDEARRATYRNPVIPGFFPDPSIVRVGSDYYLVNSTFQYFPGIIISHSRDLVHWRQIGHALTRSGDLDLSGYFDGCGVWAPDISFHNGEFFIFYCLVQLSKDRSVNVRGNYMIRSRQILGPWSHPVQLISEGNDPSHFVDADGRHYLLYAAGNPLGRGTKIVPLTDDCSRTAGEPQWIDYGLEMKAPEGPHLFRRGGYYYHTMAAGSGFYEGHHQLIARSRSLLGPYELSPHNPFLAQFDLESPCQHQGHAKLVETPSGEWWTVYLLRRPMDGFSPLGRETGLDRVDWLDDGWPVVNGGHGPSDVHATPDPHPSEVSDPFSDHVNRDGFGPEWQFVRGRDPEAVKAGDRPGHLTLLTRSHHLTDVIQPSLILQRERLHRFSASCRMEFVSEGTEEAGLAAYYDSQSHLALSVSGSSWQTIRVKECRGGASNVLVEIREKNAGPIELRMDVDGLRRAFFYRRPGGPWKLASRVADASFLSDEGAAGWPFTGTMCGVFALDNGTGQRLSADFYDFTLHSQG